MKYDLIVIGGGSGGVRAARVSAGLGAKVAIIEDTFWGGTCVNVGCVPKKLYHYASSIKKWSQLGQSYGWDLQLGKLDWQQFHQTKEAEIARLKGIYADMLADSGCDVFDGHGKLLDAHTIQVTQADGSHQTLQADKVLLAVGGKPMMPNIPGIEYGISSDDLFGLTHIPKSMLIVGGGYIACEMASIYHQLGCEVTLAVRSRLLKAFDTQTVDFLENELVNDGLTIQKGISPVKLTNTTLQNQTTQSISVTFSDNSEASFEQVLFATGRKPRLAGLGLENTDVSLDNKGFIVVNDMFQTTQDNIYAVGDIIDGLELTPVALEQGMYLAKSLFSNNSQNDGQDEQAIKPQRPAFDTVATAIFTHPQLASVGMTEEQAQKHVNETGDTIAVYTSSFRHIKYTVTPLQKRTFIKLMVNQRTDKLMGIQMVGDEVGEIMQGFAVLLHTEISKTQLDQTIGIHPTVAEELVTMRVPTRIVSFQN